MNVAFTVLDDFLEDLAVEADAERVDEKIVRICLEHLKENQTTTHVSITAGYSCLGELRNLVKPCGTDYTPKTAGSEVAAEVLKRLESMCEEKGLKVRGGKFESD